MPTTFEHFAAEIRSFDRRREVVKALTKALRSGLPPVRKEIRASALALLPKSGGLAAWVAKISITARLSTGGRTAGIKLRGGRNSSRKRSDVDAIDRGRVRAPSWGRRGAGSWHNQTVAPGFFSRPAGNATAWHREVDHAVDEAFEQLRR